jgi:hypothetical protein
MPAGGKEMHCPKKAPQHRRGHGKTLALALLACFAPSMAAAQVDCLAVTPGVRRSLVVQSGLIGYYGSHDLTTAYNHEVKRAVIMLHGLSRNAAGAYETLVSSACLAEGQQFTIHPTRETVLLAPHFQTEDDLLRLRYYHYWKSDDRWVGGYHSEVNPTVSSYAVIDAIINQLVGKRSLLDPRRRFPNLEMIVVAGHSAGGQFTHRYAATNSRDGNLPGIRMRYVVANPSSYLYLDNRRPHFDGSAGFGVPYRYVCVGFSCAWEPSPGFWGAPLCPASYNDWRYGLADLNDYAGAVGAATIHDRLLGRKVTLLLGTLDNDPHHDQLDNTCPGKLQGPNRYDRGQNLLAYLDERFPGHRHDIVNVDGADHDDFEMFVAPPGGAGTGSAVLFYDF